MIADSFESFNCSKACEKKANQREVRSSLQEVLIQGRPDSPQNTHQAQLLGTWQTFPAPLVVMTGNRALPKPEVFTEKGRWNAEAVKVSMTPTKHILKFVPKIRIWNLFFFFVVVYKLLFKFWKRCILRSRY